MHTFVANRVLSRLRTCSGLFCHKVPQVFSTVWFEIFCQEEAFIHGGGKYLLLSFQGLLFALFTSIMFGTQVRSIHWNIWNTDFTTFVFGRFRLSGMMRQESNLWKRKRWYHRISKACNICYYRHVGWRSPGGRAFRYIVFTLNEIENSYKFSGSLCFL